MTKLEETVRRVTADPNHYPQTSREEAQRTADWILSYAAKMSTEWQNITAKMDNGDWFWIAETLVFWGLAERDFRPAKTEWRRDANGERKLEGFGCRCFFRLKPEAIAGFVRLNMLIAFAVIFFGLTALANVGLLIFTERQPGFYGALASPVNVVTATEGPHGIYYSGCTTDSDCEAEWKRETAKGGIVHNISEHAGHFDATLTRNGRDYQLTEFETREALIGYADQMGFAIEEGAR